MIVKSVDSLIKVLKFAQCALLVCTFECIVRKIMYWFFAYQKVLFIGSSA